MRPGAEALKGQQMFSCGGIAVVLNIRTQYWSPLIAIFYHGDLDVLRWVFSGSFLVWTTTERYIMPFAFLVAHFPCQSTGDVVVWKFNSKSCAEVSPAKDFHDRLLVIFTFLLSSNPYFTSH